MARSPGAEVFEAYYVATIADINAPTTTELNVNTRLDGSMTDGGVTRPLDGSLVQGGDMGSKFNKTSSGTYGGQILSMEFYREFDGTEAVYSALARGTTGYAVFAPGGLASPGTFAVADEVEVWAIEVLSRNPNPVVRNENQTYTVQCAVPEVPNLDYALAT